MAGLKEKHAKEVSAAITAETEARNEILAKEVYLSVGRFGFRKRTKQNNALLDALKEAMKLGVDLSDEEQRNAVFDKVTFRVKYLDENSERLHGICILNLANIKEGRDWSQIRGTKIATVFQDPMTSLNPIITIGKQITSVIMKHQDCTENEARLRALDLMDKVGIPNPEARFDDYPFPVEGWRRNILGEAARLDDPAAGRTIEILTSQPEIRIVRHDGQLALLCGDSRPAPLDDETLYCQKDVYRF